MTEQKKCGLCRKFHTVECPAESVDSVKQKAYYQDGDSEPFSEDCFELNPSDYYIGSFRLGWIGKDVFLYNASGEPVFSTKLYLLNTEKNKAQIAALTKVSREEVERKIANFVFKIHACTSREGSGGDKEDDVEAEGGDEEITLDAETEARINEEVQKIVEAENQLEALKPHLNNVIVGEDENKQAIYVLLCGSKTKEVDKKAIVLLKGTEGGGKTTLASALTGLFKTKTVGRFT